MQPLPFIFPSASDPSKFEVGADALKFLASIGRPVAPLAIAGKARTGKSYLLNRMIQTLEQAERAGTGAAKSETVSLSGFEVGSTIQSCTKGVWLYPRCFDADAVCRGLASVAAEEEQLAQEEAKASTDAGGAGGEASGGPGSGAAAIDEEDEDSWHGAVDIHEESSASGAGILVLDTEGFGAQDASEEHDARIFALATLLCSLLAYNSVGTISEGAIQSLSFVANLTKHIQTRGGGAGGSAVAASSGSGAGDGDDADAAPSSGDAGAGASPAGATGGGPVDGQAREGTGQDLPAFLPSFLWILRDFALELIDPEDGSRLSPRDYLEQSLEEDDSNFREDTRARNRTRRSLKSFFRDRDCAMLRRPTEQEDDLQRLEDMPLHRLRPAFRRGLHALFGQVFGVRLKPKTLYGEQVTGRVLGGLAAAYVGAINNNAVPSITGAWEGVAAAECEAARRLAAGVLEEGTGALLKSLPREEDDVVVQMERLSDRVLGAFKGRAIGGEQAQGVHLRALQEGLQQLRERALAENKEASRVHCMAVLAELRVQYLEPSLDALRKGTSSGGRGGDVGGGGPAGGSSSQGTSKGEVSAIVWATESAIAADLSSLVTRYRDRAKGPSRQACLNDFLAGILPTVAETVGAARSREEQARTEAWQQRASTAERQLTGVQAELHEARAQLRRAQSTASEARQDRARLQGQLEAAQAQATRSKAAVEDAERRVASFEAEAESARASAESSRAAVARAEARAEKAVREAELTSSRLGEMYEDSVKKRPGNKRGGRAGDGSGGKGEGEGGEAVDKVGRMIAMGEQDLGEPEEGAGGAAGKEGEGGSGERRRASAAYREDSMPAEDMQGPGLRPKGGQAFGAPARKPPVQASGGCCTIS